MSPKMLSYRTHRHHQYNLWYVYVRVCLAIYLSACMTITTIFLVFQIASRFKTVNRNKIICSAVQESSTTSTSGMFLHDRNQNFGLVLLRSGHFLTDVSNHAFVVLATAETKGEVKAAAAAAPKAATGKKAPPAKAPVKPLPQMMEEDVIPSLKTILESNKDLSDIELVFQDNKVSNVAVLCMSHVIFQITFFIIISLILQF